MYSIVQRARNVVIRLAAFDINGSGTLTKTVATTYRERLMSTTTTNELLTPLPLQQQLQHHIKPNVNIYNSFPKRFAK